MDADCHHRCVAVARGCRPCPSSCGRGNRRRQPHAIRQDDAVVLGVQLTSPVHAIFAVAFSYVQHRGFLKDVAEAGALIFATTDVENAIEDQPLWLSVDIDGSALLETLRLSPYP